MDWYTAVLQTILVSTAFGAISCIVEMEKALKTNGLEKEASAAVGDGWFGFKLTFAVCSVGLFINHVI